MVNTKEVKIERITGGYLFTYPDGRKFFENKTQEIIGRLESLDLI